MQKKRLQSPLRCVPAYQGHSLVTTIYLVFACVLSLAEIRAQCVGHWIGGQPVPGVAGAIYCSTVFDDGTGPALFVGGSFTVAGDTLVSNVAKWDGVRWCAVGTRQLNGPVTALTAFEGKLVVGGSFTRADRELVYGVARLDGGLWVPMGSGLYRSDITTDENVRALVVSQGKLFAGGSFTRVRNGPSSFGLSVFQGGEWSPVPGVSLTGAVWALAEFRGDLVIAGAFTRAATGAQGTLNIARWNGFSCLPLGAGLSGPAVALAVFEDQLIVGGDFLLAYNSSSQGVETAGTAAWDGVQWSVLGYGLQRGALSFGAFGDDLFATGSFHFTSGDDGAVARWDGVEWEPVGNGFNDEVRTVVAFQGSLFAGVGYYAGLNGDSGLKRLLGDVWQDFGPGIIGEIQRIVPFNGGVVATGFFDTPSSPQLNGMAMFDGEAWTPFGNPGEAEGFSVLAVVNDVLYAMRYRREAETVLDWCIVRWDGTGWVQLGGFFNSSIESIALWQDRLVAVGSFTQVDGAAADRVAAFGSDGWEPLGDGVGDGTVYAAAVYAGELYVGGNFGVAGGSPSKCIARFDGIRWRSVGPGFTSGIGGSLIVKGLAVFNGELIATGVFAATNDQPGRCISRWNGTAWSLLPGSSSQYSEVKSPVVIANRVFAMDRTVTFGGPYGFLTWDGSVIWQMPGSSVPIATLCNWDSRTVAVAGSFSRIANGDGTPPVQSHLFARYGFDSADFDGDGFPTGADLDAFIIAFEMGDLSADVDENGFVTGADYDRFVRALLGGC